MLVLALAAVVTLWILAARYQVPLAYGGSGVRSLAYPGMPAGQGIRTVNTFGGVREDIYVPPQRQGYTFYLFADVQNYGSRAVTIQAVTLPPDSPLTPAGPVRYTPAFNPAYPDLGIPPANHVLRSATLDPGRDIFLAIPVRGWPCWVPGMGMTTVPDFYVTYRFLFFTHTAAVPWGMTNDELITHPRFGKPGQPGAVCTGK